MHRFVWDLREPAPIVDQTDLPISAVPHDTPLIPQGALASPGTYIVKLIVDGRSQESRLRLSMDPRVSMTQSQFDEQYFVAHDIAATIGKTTKAARESNKKLERKRSEQLTRLQDQLSFLLEVVDGADAPVTKPSRDAYCTLMTQARELNVAPSPAKALCRP